ncbi:MAG: site-2 protease family protein [Planctomycetota bacterium]
MPFASPSPTQADLRFQLFGFPVRIHPFFWVLCLLVGREKEPLRVLVWTLVVLVSVLVHELGHAVLQRRFGGRPNIVLYGMGGLAIPNGPPVSPWRQIAISLAGPGAGFLLAAGVTIAVVLLPEVSSPVAAQLLNDLLLVNIVWGVLNLLPIYPLDGGHVARELLLMKLRPDRGIVASLWLSIGVCVALAALILTRGFSLWNLLLVGLLGFSNYQALQAYQQSRRGGW